MKKPEKLFHATPTQNVESILRDGLRVHEYTAWKDGIESHGHDPVNLSTEDETNLVAFFGDANGCIGEDGQVTDTITLLEVDVHGLPLTWPGMDGPHHFECHQVITPDRIRVVSVCDLAQVQASYEGESLDSVALDDVFSSMEEAAKAHDRGVVLE